MLALISFLVILSNDYYHMLFVIFHLILSSLLGYESVSLPGKRFRQHGLRAQTKFQLEFLHRRTPLFGCVTEILTTEANVVLFLERCRRFFFALTRDWDS